MKIIPYRHPNFQPGTMVYVHASIKDEYPLCPLADQTVRVTKQWVDLPTFIYIMFSEKQVPVIFKKVTWFVEEEYIRPLYSSSRRLERSKVK